MSEHPFLILCGGDTAEADDWESAKFTAVQLVKDRLDPFEDPREYVAVYVEIKRALVGLAP